jgi:7-carboxy-7-deazaguanine synthase (Cx14CxxC type)
MIYSVKEVFYTLQGEGAHTGRAAVFCRFSGCNLWSGRENDRSSAVCQFCDTDFVGVDGQGGGKFSRPDLLADAIEASWPQQSDGLRFVVCTGGEPLLQLDEALIQELHERKFEIAIETNGTVDVPPGVDWVQLDEPLVASPRAANGPHFDSSCLSCLHKTVCRCGRTTGVIDTSLGL